MRVTVPDHVYAEVVGDETVLLELGSGRYYGLDPIGTRLWQLLVEMKSTEDVVAAASEEFDVAPAQLAKDIATLVSELAARKLVVVHAAPDSPTGNA